MNIKPGALLFDMDGTLTDPRQLITSEVLEVLQSIPAVVTKHLVTGSDMVKVEEPLNWILVCLVSLLTSIKALKALGSSILTSKHCS